MEYKIKRLSSRFFGVFLIICLFINNNFALASGEPSIRVLIKKDSYLRLRADNSIPFFIEGDTFKNKRTKGLTIKEIDIEKTSDAEDTNTYKIKGGDTLFDLADRFGTTVQKIKDENNLTNDTIYLGETLKISRNNQKDKKFVLFFDKEKEKLYDLPKKDAFVVKTSDRRGVWVGGERYSGKLNIVLDGDQIFVVNKIGLEKYLSSVVGGEMPQNWPIEALKAQAIASRTYALRKKGNDLYDIDSTQKDQVYNGLESKTFKTSKSVNSTRSLVIIHNKKLINALFHSSSGGMTENSQDVWNDYYPYLQSVKDFDKNNPKLRWEKYFSKKELADLFPSIGGVQNIKILNITETGRVKNLKIDGNEGSKEFSGTEFRNKMGLKSTLFRFKFIEDSSGRNLLVSGMGSGHAVGMSQWGAKYMAEKGFRAKDILKHYYTGIEIKSFKNIYK